MSEEICHPDGRIEHPSVRHEHTDADWRWILGIVVGAAVLGLLTFSVVLWFFQETRDSLAESRRSRFPLAQTPGQRLPPEPRLEQLDRLSETSSANVYVRQIAQLDILHSYGATEEKGFVHIPIDRAMALLVNKLPARREPPTAIGVAVTGSWGLLAAPKGPFLAVSALFPGRNQIVQDVIERRQQGLVDGGESNSGRMFKKRKPS